MNKLGADAGSLAVCVRLARAAAIQSSSSWYQGRGNTHDTCARSVARRPALVMVLAEHAQRRRALRRLEPRRHQPIDEPEVAQRAAAMRLRLRAPIARRGDPRRASPHRHVSRHERGRLQRSRQCAWFVRGASWIRSKRQAFVRDLERLDQRARSSMHRTPPISHFTGQPRSNVHDRLHLERGVELRRSCRPCARHRWPVHVSRHSRSPVLPDACVKPCLSTMFDHFVAPDELERGRVAAALAHRNDLGLVPETADALEEQLSARRSSSSCTLKQKTGSGSLRVMRPCVHLSVVCVEPPIVWISVIMMNSAGAQARRRCRRPEAHYPLAREDCSQRRILRRTPPRDSLRPASLVCRDSSGMRWSWT